MKRWPIAIHVLIQLLAIFTIFYFVNHLSCRHYDRIDLTKSGKFTLSSQTTNFIGNLEFDIDLVVAFSRSTDKGLLDDLRALTDEYRIHSNGRVRVELVDPIRYPNRAVELEEKYKVSLDRNMVIVAYGDRIRVIEDRDLAARTRGDVITSFYGEVVLTAAMIEVTADRQRKIYVVRGYQRVDYLNAVAEEIATLANRQNALVDFLDLTEGKIPEDADTIVLAAPQTDLSPAARKLVEDFWNSERGSIFLALDPEAKTPELHRMLGELGVFPRDDRVLYAGGAAGGPIQTTFNVTTRVMDSPAITHELSGMSVPLGGKSQSIKITPGADAVLADNILLTPLLEAEPRFWGETDYRETDNYSRHRTDDYHHKDGLYLAVAVERGAVADPKLRVATQRMIVVSNPTIFTPSRMMTQEERERVRDNPEQTIPIMRLKARSDFVISSLNWLLDRPELQGISPKEPKRYTVVLEDGEKTLITTLVLWILPGLSLGFGIFVWAMRRN